MNAEEAHLINDLFERLRAHGAVDKDREAEQLIINNARSNPDAGYMLVQNILVQEHVMQQQQQQIEDLQAQLAAVQRGGNGQRSGGFLGGNAGTGGMFGGGARPAAASVPPMGRPAPQPQAYNQQPSSSPWGRTGSAPQQPQYQQPAPQAAPAAAGGGFMRSAFGMAAGVAGGMLAANAISNMMRGNEPGNQPASGDLGGNDPGNYQSSSQDSSAAEPSYTDSSNDPGNYEEPADNSWDGGGDVEL